MADMYLTLAIGKAMSDFPPRKRKKQTGAVPSKNREAAGLSSFVTPVFS
jgi:hypothetical protein